MQTIICVPSLDRSDNATTLDYLSECNLISETYIFVYDFDVESYRNKYPTAKIVTCNFEKNLANKRNYIIKFAKEMSELKGYKYLLMIDDDLQNIALKRNDVISKITIADLINEYENVALELHDDFVVIGSRYNFMSIDNKYNTLSLYSNISADRFFNIKKLNYEFDNTMFIEDIDLLIRICLDNEKFYCVKFIQSNFKLCVKGGLQNYQTATNRLSLGYKQLIDKYSRVKNITKVVRLSRTGNVSINKKSMEIMYYENQTDNV